MARLVLWLIFSCIVGLFAASCSDEPNPQTPEESCDEFVAKFCSKDAECRDTDYHTCTSVLYQQVNCAAATKNIPDRCMSDIDSQYCPVWNANTELPASCSVQ